MGDVPESTVSRPSQAIPRPFGSETRQFDKSPVTARKVDFDTTKGVKINENDIGTSKYAESDLSKSTTSTQTADQIKNLKKPAVGSQSQPTLRKVKSGTT